jgi:hypothetical protein
MKGVVAWGPMHQAFRNGISHLTMKMRDEGMDLIRLKLERSFYRELDESMESEHTEEWEFNRDSEGGSYGMSNEWTLEAVSACGDDCEECLIPEDFKIIPNSQKDLDVLSFLGIRRVEPLNAKRSLLRDWD